MYRLYLITKLILLGFSTSINNIIVECKIRLFIRFHNRTVKKAIRAYNRDLKKMSKLNSIRIRIRDKILNSKTLRELATIQDMDKLENSIEELDEIIEQKHDEFLDYLNELFDRSKDAINEYNRLVDKQKGIPYLFYRCNKVYMSEIIHGVKHSGR